MPFAFFLGLALVSEADAISTAYAALAFVLILGIKELVIVDRRTGYGLVVFMLTFAGLVALFDRFAAWRTPFSFFTLACVALLWRWLLLADPERSLIDRTAVNIAALLFFEAGAVTFFLPLSAFYQAAVFFFASVILFEVTSDFPQASPRQLAVWSGTYAAVAFLVVLLAPWKV